MRCTALALLWGTALLAPCGAQAQQVTGSVGLSPGATLRDHHTLGYLTPRSGPVALELGAVHLGAVGGDRWGFGMEITVTPMASTPAYLRAGVAGGWGSDRIEGTWGGWSAGVGYELIRSRWLRLAAEGRLLRLSNPGDAGVLGLRLGIPVGAGRAAAVGGSARLPVPMARSDLAQSVIQAALDAMGTPYAWGGTDANGFDCSGLIQYAFRQGGVNLPRTSREQARAGEAVPRAVEALQPGDILTFAEQGGAVSHVGLYLGGGEFIHSASQGVRVSRLSPEDPDGGYWWRRWVAARRLLTP